MILKVNAQLVFLTLQDRSLRIGSPKVVDHDLAYLSPAEKRQFDLREAVYLVKAATILSTLPSDFVSSLNEPVWQRTSGRLLEKTREAV